VVIFFFFFFGKREAVNSLYLDTTSISDYVMGAVGALLWRTLRVYQVYGANTDVGKTVASTILCKTAKSLYKNDQVAFVKPVSTGPHDEADDR